jgi:FkbM family methyltransferase
MVNGSIADVYRRLVPTWIRTPLGRLRNYKAVAFERAMDKAFATIKEGKVLMSGADFHGEIWIDVRSHIARRILINQYYEPEITALINSHLTPGRDFIDVGANVGIYSIHAGLCENWNGTIAAIEPNPRAFEFLLQNIAHNHLADRIKPLMVAATKEVSELSMTVYDGREEYSTLSGNVHPSARQLESKQVTVQGKPIDQIVEMLQLQPGLMKIDAEGFEFNVLEGASQTLKIHRPVLICEIGGGTFQSETTELAKLLKGADYEMFNLDGDKIAIHSGFSGEILAKPASK